jgi:serine/threonine-protein kinase
VLAFLVLLFGAVSLPREVGDDQGRYVVGELLGEGAMGVVHAGRGARGEQVAIKFLHEHLAGIPEVVERFQREARIVGRLRSPFIAPVRLAGRTQGRLWIAYRRLHGETLESRLARERVLGAGAVGRIIAEVLEGLGIAHQAGVIHRDIKPANLFLERLPTSERACVLDFGVSKYTPPPGATTGELTLTSTRQMLGTLSYMAPEQIEGAARVDARVDLFSLGVVAFRAVTGTLPFERKSTTALLRAKLDGNLRTLGAATGLRWPEEWEAWMREAMAVGPDDRFASSELMLEKWRAVVERGGAPDAREVLEGRGRESHANEATEQAPPSSR